MYYILKFFSFNLYTLSTPEGLFSIDILHAVGPRGGDPDRKKLLKSCYQKCFELAEEKGMKTLVNTF